MQFSRRCFHEKGLNQKTREGCGCFWACEPFSPLQPSKTPETPNLSKICPSDCFGGFQSGGLKFGKICRQNLSENYLFRTNFDKFFQISVPLTGTPQNNRWDKFWTNLGFRAFLKAVRGKRVRNSGLFAGVLEESSGKLTERCSRITKCFKFYGFGHRERQTCRNIGSTLPWTVCRPSVQGGGCFLKPTVTTFSSFFGLKSA